MLKLSLKRSLIIIMLIFFLLTVMVLSLKLSLTATMLKLSLTTDNKLVIIVLDVVDHQTVINDHFGEAIVTIFMSINITSVDIVNFGIYSPNKTWW